MKPAQISVKNRVIKRHASRQNSIKNPEFVPASTYSTYDERVRLLNYLDHCARVKTKRPDAVAKDVWPHYYARVVGTLEKDGVFGYASESSEVARLAASSGESKKDQDLSDDPTEWEWDADWED